MGPSLCNVYLGKHPPPEDILEYELLLRGVQLGSLFKHNKGQLAEVVRTPIDMANLINNTELALLYKSAYIPSLRYLINHAPTGRLSLLREYGGKQRIFAIPAAPVQIVLRPIHDVIFSLFGDLSSDYTMDQSRFRRDMVRGKWAGRESWSYDLKSATDRFPISLQVAVINELFLSVNNDVKIDGHSGLGQLWQEVIQSGPYVWRDGRGVVHLFNYSSGQPMGAVSS